MIQKISLLAVFFTFCSPVIAQPPSTPDAFAADMTSTLAGISLSGSVQWDGANERYAFTSTAFGVPSTTIALYEDNLQYVTSTVFGQTSCSTCFLPPPYYPLIISTSATNEGSTQLGDGTTVTHWTLSSQTLGASLDWYVDATPVVRKFVFTEFIFGTTFVMEFSNVKPGPQPESAFTPDPTCSQTALCKAALNLCIAVDSSGSMSTTDWQQELDFTQALGDALDISSTNVNIGLVNFGSYAGSTLKMTDNRSAFNGAINNIRSYTPSGGTAIGDALDRCGMVKSSRSGVPMAIVVLTDGVSNSGVDPATVATSLKNDGVELFMIGVGTGVDSQKLTSYASSPSASHYFETDFGSAMNAIINKVVASVCTQTQCTA